MNPRRRIRLAILHCTASCYAKSSQYRSQNKTTQLQNILRNRKLGDYAGRVYARTQRTGASGRCRAQVTQVRSPAFHACGSASSFCARCSHSLQKPYIRHPLQKNNSTYRIDSPLDAQVELPTQIDQALHSDDTTQSTLTARDPDDV